MWEFVLGAFVPWINLKIDWLWRGRVSAHNQHIREQYSFFLGFLRCPFCGMLYFQSRESAFCIGGWNFKKHHWSSLSKEPDVFLVWFIQMQRLGLRDSAVGKMHSACVHMVAYTFYCHSSCKWVFLIYMNRTFHFLWIEHIASLARTWHIIICWVALQKCKQQ